MKEILKCFFDDNLKHGTWESESDDDKLKFECRCCFSPEQQLYSWRNASKLPAANDDINGNKAEMNCSNVKSKDCMIWFLFHCTWPSLNSDSEHVYISETCPCFVFTCNTSDFCWLPLLHSPQSIFVQRVPLYGSTHRSTTNPIYVQCSQCSNRWFI